ncbi:glycosyltransferase family 9 protein [Deferribacterales bacterium Es71-Z0220]|jgi:ADP-heptose:LPS heptosyltransferase|uniref:glycosyltransferase family 9 protein n=1 Tax=Deferrivibrio essentukiensis TaxID=2880922 RepID=UPI001F614BCA|nr:glycosyltransferase family 9 protein [Deferrivibrio essentukiensis]MBZ4643307.1 ADP-heptose:LPS heptosyltransferase [Deferribacteraceae bacterium]MCB4204563.1 glycosyltransferase family 9 protein [Deferrivibrio essentukiensis]MDK2792465.1 heptosyltransferase [Deferribacteres bacterium]
MKTLIIQLYQIGDVVLTTQIPREIKRKYPDSEIHFLTTPMCNAILKYDKNIDKILSIKRDKNPLQTLKLIKDIRKEKYDYILDFQNNPRTMWISLLSKAKYRVTYSYTKRKLAYNKLIEPLKGTATEIKCSLLKSLGINEYNIRPVIYPGEKEIEKVKQYLKNNNIEDFVVISPTHKGDTRRWTLDNYIKLAEYIHMKTGFKIIFSYGPNEDSYLDKIKKHKLYNSVFFTNAFSLSEFVAILSLSRFHSGNDSSPFHMAVALNKPSFVILGASSEGWIFPSNEYRWVRKNLECQPCKSNKCKYGDNIPCLHDFSFDEIKDDFNNFLQEVIGV